LENGLKEVSKYGWTIQALALAAEKEGLPRTAHGLVKDGPVELIHYFVSKMNKEMVTKLEKIDLESLNVRDRIKTIIKIRLELLIPLIHTWSQALGILAIPTNIPGSLHSLAILLDEICYQAGDRSTDFDWYTKRATIAGIYTSTELYMLSDNSADFVDTWKFLDRRIEDVIKLSKITTEVDRGLGVVVKGASSFFFTIVSDVSGRLLGNCSSKNTQKKTTETTGNNI